MADDREIMRQLVAVGILPRIPLPCGSSVGLDVDANRVRMTLTSVAGEEVLLLAMEPDQTRKLAHCLEGLADRADAGLYGRLS